MSDRRPWPVNVTAACLLGAGWMMALSVYSHDSADLSGEFYPTNPTVRNLVGVPGAYIARGLLQALGVSVHVFLASWFVLVLMLLIRRWRVWSLRLAGWLLLIPCVAVAGDRLGEVWTEGVSSGLGGSLGAWLAAWFESRFHPAGSLAILGACMVFGSVLALDQVFLCFCRAIHVGLLWFQNGRSTTVKQLPVRLIAAEIEEDDTNEETEKNEL